jgi:hypothetical protein
LTWKFTLRINDFFATPQVWSRVLLALLYFPFIYLFDLIEIQTDDQALGARITEMEDLIKQIILAQQDSPQRQRKLDLLTAMSNKNKIERVDFLETLLRDEMKELCNEGEIWWRADREMVVKVLQIWDHRLKMITDREEERDKYSPLWAQIEALILVSDF